MVFSAGSSMIKEIRAQGFTLVELLVVIGVIAVLTGIVVPSLGKARAMAKRTVCQSHLHSAALAFRMYLDDNNHIMPPAARLPSANLNDKPPIADFIRPFIKDTKALRCPADDGHRRKGRTQRYYETEGSSYEYWQQIGGARVGVGYLAEKVIFNEEKVHEREVQVLYDYTNFHGKKGRKGSVNYLYADGHIGDRAVE
jgi:prepilin-type N-terminal cleavage/methylation domain-containing protein/prepilin-type processing-associated H-X9-DG protein